jgi:hypothetical protein
MTTETSIRPGIEKAIVALGRRLARRSAVQDAPAVLAALAPFLQAYIAAYKRYLVDHNRGARYWYTRRYVRCKRPDCVPCRRYIGHGPYWYATRRADGRQFYIGRKFFLRPDDTTPRERSLPCPVCGSTILSVVD